MVLLSVAGADESSTGWICSWFKQTPTLVPT